MWNRNVIGHQWEVVTPGNRWFWFLICTRRVMMMRSSQQTHYISQWRGRSPSLSSLEVQITSKSHLLSIWNLYDKSKTYIVALQRKWNKNKINMLVHICHSLSYHACSQKAKNPADWRRWNTKVRRRHSVISSLGFVSNSSQLQDSDECILHWTTCWLRLKIENLRNV